MQLVLCNNRVIAHGSGFVSLGGVVINNTTGKKYENATIAECEGCPADINEMGYEYHAGVFVPCAPYGKGNNNGYFMEICEECATPRNSGIPIKKGIKLENLNEEVTANALGGTMITLLWENASPSSDFAAQTITLASGEWDFLLCESTAGIDIISSETTGISQAVAIDDQVGFYIRGIEEISENTITFKNGDMFSISLSGSISRYVGDTYIKPLKVYGVKI